FFFQAEDGIRDKLVTGVQTCALPIFSVTSRRRPRPTSYRRRTRRTRACRPAAPDPAPRRRTARWGSTQPRYFRSDRYRRRPSNRSEERRVGKEGRSRVGGGYLTRKKE